MVDQGGKKSINIKIHNADHSFKKVHNTYGITYVLLASQPQSHKLRLRIRPSVVATREDKIIMSRKERVQFLLWFLDLKSAIMKPFVTLRTPLRNDENKRWPKREILETLLYQL